MKTNLKNYLFAGTIAFGTLFSGFSQAQSPKLLDKLSADVLAESEKYPTATHFIYEIQKNSDRNFNDVKTLEKIISNVESKFPKKQEYSKEEAIKILNTVHEEINSFGLKYN